MARHFFWELKIRLRLIFTASSAFAYERGTHIMYRTAEKSLLSFFSDYQVERNIRIEPATATMRVHLIPLVLQDGRDLLMDANAKILSSRFFTQRSCMGLYPRYLKIIEEGGEVFCAVNRKDLLCGVASFRKAGTDSFFVDAFSAPGYEFVITDLLASCRRPALHYYALLSDVDTKKAPLIFQKMGFTENIRQK